MDGIDAVTDTAPPRVLLVEDEPDIAAGIRRTLESLDCDIEWVDEGAAGLERALNDDFDLVIVDLLLPKMNGYVVVSQLRAAENWTPVLVLTAKSGEWDEAESLDSGADDFLTKPVSSTVLLAHVRALLRRNRYIRVRQMFHGNVALDVVRHECRVGSDAVELSARETEVMAHLMLRRGDVVSKTDLMEAVWGEGFPGDPNIVQVYVRHLRRKLEKLNAGPIIETVWGSGYRLSPLEQ
jgi:two-component system, OmpR family, response regulator